MLVICKTRRTGGYLIARVLSKRFPILALPLALLASPVAATDYQVQAVSDPDTIAREPVISETGMAAWSAYKKAASEMLSSDINVYYDGELKILTADKKNQGMINIRPQVHSNTVVWVGTFNDGHVDPDWILREVPADQRDSPHPELKAVYYPHQGEAGWSWEDEPPKGALFTNEVQEAEAASQSATNAVSALPTSTQSPPASAPAPQAGAPSTNPPPQPFVLEPPPDTSRQDNEARRFSSGDNEICYWTKGGMIKRITRDTRDDLGPSVWGSIVAWQKAKGWPFGWEMMVWADDNRYQLTTNFYYDMAPQVHGSQVVWYGWDGNDFEIFLFDHSAMSITQITSNQYDDVSPAIWGDVIVWEGYAGMSADVFMHKDGSVRKISDNIEDDLNPQVWNGHVVWQGFDGDDFEIYLYDIERDERQKLTSNRYDDVNPDIRDGIICWMGYHENWDSEIYARKIDGGSIWLSTLSDKDREIIENENRLTLNDLEDRDPKTAGGRIIWQTDKGEQSTIYLAEPK